MINPVIYFFFFLPISSVTHTRRCWCCLANQIKNRNNSSFGFLISFIFFVWNCDQCPTHYAHRISNTGYKDLIFRCFFSFSYKTENSEINVSCHRLVLIDRILRLDIHCMCDIQCKCVFRPFFVVDISGVEWIFLSVPFIFHSFDRLNAILLFL